ncbi:hypothetical protein BDP27DRAFT_1321322, partial [Rhodocollybia butyracea]
MGPRRFFISFPSLGWLKCFSILRYWAFAHLYMRRDVDFGRKEGKKNRRGPIGVRVFAVGSDHLSALKRSQSSASD